MKKNWNQLNRQIEDCQACPRLLKHCRSVAEKKRKAYLDWEYWGGPVPNFGQLPAPLLIVGLAPGAHGANRTGRMFTGDRSGDWLYRALHRAGFASQPESVSRTDGLRLKGCVITAICHCAPPDNKPTRDEKAACQPWLTATIDASQPRVYLALGKIAWDGLWPELAQRFELTGPRPKFSHGATVPLSDRHWLIGSYHPSQQNTFTGRLTEAMLDRVVNLARKYVDE